MGKQPPYIVGGTIQPLPPLQPRRERYYRLASGTTACPYKRYYRFPSRYCRWAQSGTTAVVRAVLPHTSGTTAPTAATTAAEPDTRKPRLESRRYQRGTGAVLPLMAMGGTTAVGQRYYCLWRYAVLPLRSSGTTAGANLMPQPQKQRILQGKPELL